MGLNSSKYLNPDELYQNKNYVEALDFEQKILKYSGLKVGEQVKIENVKINEHIHIHTLKVKTQENLPELKEKKKLLLLHGYMSSGAQYYKMFEKLSKEYDIYAIDLPGMGLSSRPQFPYQTYYESLDFFINSIEQFAKQQNLDKFSLVGHSFGGYISAQYTIKNPQQIDNLFLLSPLGVTARNEMELRDYESKMAMDSTIRKLLFNYIKSQFSEGQSFLQLANKPFVPTNWVLKKWMNYWFPGQEKEQERQYFTSYMSNLLELPTSSDKALNQMFYFQRLAAKVPLEYALAGSPVNTYFYFGDKDWMCKEGAKRMQMNNCKKEFHIVKNAGHNLQFDQPAFLCDQILSKK